MPIARYDMSKPMSKQDLRGALHLPAGFAKEASGIDLCKRPGPDHRVKSIWVFGDCGVPLRMSYHRDISAAREVEHDLIYVCGELLEWKLNENMLPGVSDRQCLILFDEMYDFGVHGQFHPGKNLHRYSR